MTDAWDEVLAFLAGEYERGRPYVSMMTFQHIRFMDCNAFGVIPHLISEGLVTFGGFVAPGCVSITPGGLSYHNVGATAP